MANGRPWTSNDTATLRRMNGAGYSDGEIAEHTGHCRETITRRRLALGLDPTRRKDRAQKRSLEIERMSK